jgi:hypothetical protein
VPGPAGGAGQGDGSTAAVNSERLLNRRSGGQEVLS